MVNATVADVRLVTNTTTSDISDADITTFLGNAKDFVESELSGVYVVPFTTQPPLISRIVRDLAGAMVLNKLFAGVAPNKSVTAEVLETTALKILDDIKNRKKKLYDDAGKLIARLDGVGIEVEEGYEGEVFPSDLTDIPDIKNTQWG
jgi:hypothetical protein